MDERARGRAYAMAVVTVAVATLAGLAAGFHVSLADEAMLYLSAIMLAALRGRGPALTASALSVAAFDFFFVPPRYTFAVADARSPLTFVMMFVVGAAMGTLISRLRRAETESRDRERDTSALLAFTRDAAAANDATSVETAVATHVRSAVGAPVSVSTPPGTEELEIEVAGELSDEQRDLVDGIRRQARLALGRLRLAADAHDAAVRARAQELRTTLLSSVSHDLRTPLAVITGMASTLRADAAEHQRDNLDTIVEEAQRLSRILTNVLAVTRVESGAAPRREWVPLEELVGAALSRLEAELMHHHVTAQVPEGLLAYVDPILVDQLLANLLENAARHTPPGTAIEVRADRDPAGAILEVRDRGPGLPAGAHDRLFEKFARDRRTQTSGVGLGLAVCRGIALAHRGEIEGLDREGGGAIFRVRFPDAGVPLELVTTPPSTAEVRA